MSVLMSEPFIHSTDSFRNEAIDCPYEWATESLTHSIHSVKKHRCVLLRDTQPFCCGFNLNYFGQRNGAKS